MSGITQIIVAGFLALLFSQPTFLMFALTTYVVVHARRTGVWGGGCRWTRDEHPEWFRLGVTMTTVVACLFGVLTVVTFVFVFWMFAFRSQPSGPEKIAEQLVGQWELADGSDYVVEFTRDGTMSVRNHAGEPQVLLAGDERLPCRFLSDSVVGVPNRGLNVPDDVAFEEAGYFFVFSVSIEQDRLTMRGQSEGETIILTQDGEHEVRFPGSESQPLEFIRRR